MIYYATTFFDLEIDLFPLSSKKHTQTEENNFKMSIRQICGASIRLRDVNV